MSTALPRRVASALGRAERALLRALEERRRQRWTVPVASVGSWRRPAAVPCFIQRRGFRSSSVRLKRDYYDVLGVPRTASKQEIKKSYLGLAKKYHPDTSSSPDKEKFVEASEAYDVLSDDDKRAMYDRFGHGAEDMGMGGGAGEGGFEGVDPFEAFRQAFGNQARQGPFRQQEMHFEDVLNDFFGGRRRPRGPQRGPDVQLALRLSFMEAARGVTSKEIAWNEILRDGRPGEKQRATTDIPPGVDTGMQLRLKGHGGKGDPGAARGDLFLQIEVQQDSYFQRDEADVHTTVDISVAQAALGTSVEVLTIDGMIDLKIPPGTQPNTQLRLRYKGIPHLSARGRGHHIVQVNVVIPTKRTPELEDLLKQLDKTDGTAANADASARAAYDRLLPFFDDDARKRYGNN